MLNKLFGRYLNVEMCTSYKYEVTRLENCFLIAKNSTAEEGDIFEVDGSNFIFEKSNTFMCD